MTVSLFFFIPWTSPDGASTTQSSSIEVIYKSSVYRNVFVHYLYKHVSSQAESMSDVTITSERDMNISNLS
jgi:hypothetical protein